MLKIYLSSILIWMIIIYCTVQIFKYKIIENGWLELKTKNNMGPFMTMFTASAVPLLRLLILAVIIYMAIYTKEDYQKLTNKEEE